MADIRDAVELGKSPKGTEKTFWTPERKWDDTLPDLPSHLSLMSICVANVQLLADVLCLSLRPAQGAECMETTSA